MGRKKKSSATEDFVELVALMPWWLGLIFATLAYLLLHELAQPPAQSVTPTSATDLARGAVSQLWRGLAQIGQYLVPALCVLGAAISVIRRHQRQKLLYAVSTQGNVQALNSMTWRQFEQMVGQWFHVQGYAVSETGGGGPDDGVDLVLKQGNERFLVQCKQWRATKVGVSVVRELYGVMAAQGATGGFVVTSGSFTDDARKFARGRNVRLLDGQSLIEMLDTVTQSKHVANAAEAAPAIVQQANTIQCPTCGAAMVKRIAKRGASAGKPFYGCTAYPACRATLPAQ